MPRFHDGVADAKKRLIREALRRTGGHQTRAAELLGLTQPYFARLKKNLGMHDP
jgi:DNA-binding NtrC family response regulator